ncbi:hypothetical protein [Mycobacterium sp. E796]|nr:hypothetical protein [Mycobacterium sp. E796]
MHDHRGDYGIDGSFKTLSARAQGMGVVAQAAVVFDSPRRGHQTRVRLGR